MRVKFTATSPPAEIEILEIFKQVLQCEDSPLHDVTKVNLAGLSRPTINSKEQQANIIGYLIGYLIGY